MRSTTGENPMSEISNTAVGPYIISSENVPRISEWLFTRGGIAIWNSVDLSDPSFSLTTPVLTAEGQPTPRPHWKVANKPARIITDSAEVVVSTDKEVRRFHVAIRPSRQRAQFESFGWWLTTDLLCGQQSGRWCVPSVRLLHAGSSHFQTFRTCIAKRMEES